MSGNRRRDGEETGCAGMRRTGKKFPAMRPALATGRFARPDPPARPEVDGFIGKAQSGEGETAFSGRRKASDGNVPVFFPVVACLANARQMVPGPEKTAGRAGRIAGPEWICRSRKRRGTKMQEAVWRDVAGLFSGPVYVRTMSCSLFFSQSCANSSKGMGLL